MENNLAAVMYDTEHEKMEAYVARLPKLPKRDRRALAAAGPQTKWIIEAVTEWWEFNYYAGSVAGLPKENILYRAALWMPRCPPHSSVLIKDAPPRVLAVNEGFGEMQDSRVRVLVTCERFSQFGIERAARELGMSVASTKSYLKQARDALAHVLRGKGWKVPKEE